MLDKRVFGKKLAAFSFAALFVCTTLGAATEQTTVLQGHVTWQYVSGYDPCIAAVAGLASSRVLWFNDQVLVDNYNFGEAYVYATEAGAPDPRGYNLAYVRSFEFDDPNGKVWNVTEYQYHVGASYEGTQSGPITPPSTTGSGGAEAREHVRAGPYYTWVVRLLDEPATDMARGSYDHSIYNFVLLVDTCKFLRGSQNGTNHLDPTVEHGTHNDPYAQYDQDSDGTHSHEMFEADLRLGEKPNGNGVYVPVGQPGADYHQKGTNSGSPYGLTP